MRVAALVAFLSCFSAAAIAHEQLDSKDGAVLPASAGKELLHQCSRGAPQDVSGAWRPTQEQIRELEIRLPSAFEAVAFQRGNEYGQRGHFRRQYAGFIVEGRKIIYVNAFPRSLGDPEPNGPPGFRHFDWHRQVVAVCDGGPVFFGVEYDPAAKTFSHFEFNGIAW